MELDDFKSTWQKFSSENEKTSQLPKEEIRRILKKRTVDITSKISRNIRIGIGIVFAWTCLGFAIDFILTPFFNQFLDKPYLTKELMFWSLLSEILNYVLIFSAILIFWIRYNKIEKTKIDTTNLKSKVTLLIQTLNSYRRMFYVILGITIIYVIIFFTTGFIMEYSHQAKEAGIDLSSLDTKMWILTILTFAVSLGLVIATYYLLFNLFYKRLYGRYLKQLKSTLNEIQEAASLSK
jgi:magnesium-transporting ATPase (P-type)